MTTEQLAETVCPERKADFLNFVTKGEDANGFGKHAETCPPCQAAIDAEFDKSVEAFQELGRSLRK